MEKMKQLNKCPNCGATIAKMVGGIMRCEYCGGEFASPYPPTINVNLGSPEDQAKMYKALRDAGAFKIQTIQPNGLARDIDGNLITQSYMRKRNEQKVY